MSDGEVKAPRKRRSKKEMMQEQLATGGPMPAQQGAAISGWGMTPPPAPVAPQPAPQETQKMSDPKNWSMTGLNFQGLGFAAPGSDRIPEGYYKAKITDSEHNGKKSIRFSIVVREGDLAGSSGLIFVGEDKSKEYNVRLWKTLGASIGVPLAALERNGINLAPNDVNGRDCYIFCKSAAEGEVNDDGKKSYDKWLFVTPDQYRVGVQAHAAGAAATGGTSLGSLGSNGTTTPATQAPPPAAPANLSNLFGPQS